MSQKNEIDRNYASEEISKLMKLYGIGYKELINAIEKMMPINDVSACLKAAILSTCKKYNKEQAIMAIMIYKIYGKLDGFTKFENARNKLIFLGSELNSYSVGCFLKSACEGASKIASERARWENSLREVENKMKKNGELRIIL